MLKTKDWENLSLGRFSVDIDQFKTIIDSYFTSDVSKEDLICDNFQVKTDKNGNLTISCNYHRCPPLRYFTITFEVGKCQP